jgi:hypothetical protein
MTAAPPAVAREIGRIAGRGFRMADLKGSRLSDPRS